MATHDYIISNASGAAVRADLNNALAAIATNNSSATEPTTTYAYQWWADTGSSPTVMKLRNAANSGWITLFQLDGEWTVVPFENGTAAAPSIYFKDSGTDTGIYSPGADQVAITTGGTGRLFVTSSGSIGIGSSTPSSYDAFADDLVIANGSGNPGITLAGSTTGWGSIYFADGTTGSEPYRGYIQYGHTNDRMTFATAGSGAMHIDSSQRVGIGASPSAKLHVNTGTNENLWVGSLGGSGAGVYLASVNDSGSANTPMQIGSASVINFAINGTERARLDSSGRWLLGTSTARSMLGFTPGIQSEATSFSQGTLSLTMNSTAGNAYPILCFARSGGTALGSNAVVSNGDIVGKMFFVAADGTDMDSSVATIEAVVDGTPGSNDLPGRLVFSTTADGSNIPTERMTINSAGTVRFGYGQSWADRGNTKGISTPDFRVWNNTSNQFIIDNYTLGVKLDGGATAWSSTSDERQKTNLEPIENGLGKIAALRAVTGRYLTDAEDVSRSFLIAQDVQAVLPEAVSVESDEDATLSLRYTEVIPLLVAALKESKERIEQLETKVAALESA